MTIRLRVLGTALLLLAGAFFALVPFTAERALGITPTPSNTFTPTHTPTSTPTPLYAPLGDASCDNEVTSTDAAIILQLVSGLLDETSCMLRADTNRDGEITSVDAALVLQYSAGLLSGLPTPTPTLTPTITLTPTRTSTPTPTVTPYTILLSAEFSIELDVDGDGTADCTTRAPGPKQCVLGSDGDLTATLSLDALPDELTYAGYSVVLEHQGFDLVGDLDKTAWPDCTFPSHSLGVPDLLNSGCAIGIGVPESTYTGPLAALTFRATCDASLSLQHGKFGAFLWNRRGSDLYVEAFDGEETLQLSCAKGFTPVPTPTFTSTPTRTSTPTSTPCAPQGCPTPTPPV